MENNKNSDNSEIVIGFHFFIIFVQNFIVTIILIKIIPTWFHTKI